MEPRHRKALYVLFAFSGFAGLIYESIWTHYLKLFLGHAAYAQALVLALFMGGMALGSWLASRLSRRWQNLLVAYAVTEAVIGVFALGFHEVFVGATGWAFDTALPALSGAPGAISTLKWSLSASLILPQCVLLGMTFPLMTAGVLRTWPDQPGRSLALLYFTNSLGAAAGVLVSGFVLVSLVGLPGTVRVAGLINLGVAVEVWRRFRRRAASGATVTAPRDGRLDRFAVLLLAASFITGASSFVYEVAWIRMLSLVLGASTHAFELMLSAFILGLALGGLWMQRRIDRTQNLVRLLAFVQVAMGVLAIATLPAYNSLFDLMHWLVNTIPHTDRGYVLFNLASNGIALAVMVPATFFAGTTLPLITCELMRRGRGESSIGAVYAANTVGAIAAVFFATHVGMTTLGVKGLLTLGGAVDLALGLLFAWLVAAEPAQRRLPLALTAVSLITLALVTVGVRLDPARMVAGVYRTGRWLDPANDKVAFLRDGKTATVSLITNNASQARISTNGKIDAAVTLPLDRPSTLDEPTMILAGLLPQALHPQARTAACIGFGSGLTTQTLLTGPRITSVDTVEIEEQMVEAARGFMPRNEKAYNDPRSHIVIDDAKTFFAAHAGKYDVIVSEPSNPWVSGVAGLFSREFYQRVRTHLAPGGVFVQWIQLYEIDVPLVMSVLKALEESFGDYTVFASNDIDMIVAARVEGEVGPIDPWIFGDPGLASAAARAGVVTPHDLQVRQIGGKKAWAGLASTFDVPPNSDYEPILDQNAARARFVGVSADRLLLFARDPLPLLEVSSSAVADPVGPVQAVWSLHFDGSRRAYDATVVRDLVAGRDLSRARFGVPERVAKLAGPLTEWLRTCERGDTPAFPLQSFLSSAQATVSDLPSRELRDLWTPLTSGACAGRLGSREQAWRDFIVALGDRDGARIASTARGLIDTSAGLAPQTLRYLVAAGMLGSLVQGRPADARALWTRHAGSISLGDDLLLRTLIARAGPG